MLPGPKDRYTYISLHIFDFFTKQKLILKALKNSLKAWRKIIETGVSIIDRDIAISIYY